MRFGTLVEYHIGRPLHKSVTLERVMALAEDRITSLEDPGVCIDCGEEAFGCEPDATEYHCESCDRLSVYAPEELILMGVA